MGRKSEHIKVYMSEDLKQQIQQAADNASLEASTYIRSTIKTQLPQEVEA